MMKSTCCRKKMCANTIRKSEFQPQREQQNTLWQVCVFVEFWAETLVIENIFFFQGGLVILPIFNKEPLSRKCQSGGKSEYRQPFPA